MSTGEPWICVVGSTNMDLVTKVPRLPKTGETVLGRHFLTSYGGKGANQAAMARKLGARVTMVTQVGRDLFGDDAVKNFRELGIDTTFVRRHASEPTGVASILVDDDGRNVIAIVPGANFALTPDDVRAARDVLASADVVVCQLEVPLEATAEALRLAKAHGRAVTIFNPAPGRTLPAGLLGLCDIVAPNETEAEAVTGIAVHGPEDAQAAARALLDAGAGSAIVTLGAQGAVVVDRSGATHIPAVPVAAVDTTGAGDAFIGTLAYFLGTRRPLLEAARLAGAAAALSVTRLGAQVSFPTRPELDEFVARGLR
jgi:ribokinase